MSNLRSDAREYAETLKSGDYAKVLITYLCAQIDQVEEYWHEAERTLKKTREREKRIAQELQQIDAFISEVNHPNAHRVRRSLSRMFKQLNEETRDE